MPPYLEALRDALSPLRLADDQPAASILFRMSGFEAQDWVIELSAEGSRLREAAPADRADLVVFCDARQMQSLVEEHFVERPLQCSGDRALLSRVIEVARS